MFGVHYINRNGGVVSKATSEADELAQAIVGARKMIDNMRRIPAEPGRPHPEGFLIFDASGEQPLHREIMD
jgi:hypothetical protein